MFFYFIVDRYKYTVSVCLLLGGILDLPLANWDPPRSACVSARLARGYFGPAARKLGSAALRLRLSKACSGVFWTCRSQAGTRCATLASQQGLLGGILDLPLASWDPLRSACVSARFARGYFGPAARKLGSAALRLRLGKACSGVFWTCRSQAGIRCAPLASQQGLLCSRSKILDLRHRHHPEYSAAGPKY